MRKNDLQDLARFSKMNFCQDLARMIVGRIEQDLARSYFLVKEKSPKKTSKIALKICLKIRFFQFFSIKKFPGQESSVGPRAGPPRAGLFWSGLARAFNPRPETSPARDRAGPVFEFLRSKIDNFD
jgi:hypothetical protein